MLHFSSGKKNNPHERKNIMIYTLKKIYHDVITQKKLMFFTSFHYLIQ